MNAVFLTVFFLIPSQPKQSFSMIFESQIKL